MSKPSALTCSLVLFSLCKFKEPLRVSPLMPGIYNLYVYSKSVLIHLDYCKFLHCQIICFGVFLVAGVAKLVFVLYKHLGQFLSTENATLRGMGDLNKHNLSLTVNSHILSASITKESSRVFVADPVIFTLEHLDVSLLLRFDLTTP